MVSGIWIHRSSGIVRLRLRSGRLKVQHSGAPLLSVEAGQRAPPSPGNELRALQHHRGSNNNPTLQPLPGRWDREGVAEDEEGKKTGQGLGLRLCHGSVVGLEMGLSICMESEGNGGDGSPVGERVERLSQTAQAGWVLRLLSEAC